MCDWSFLASDVAIQRCHCGLVALRLDMPIGVGGLADAGVPELALDPPDVHPALEQPGRERVPCRVIWPVGELARRSRGFQTFSREKG